MFDSYRKKASHYAFTFKDAVYKLLVILLAATVLIWASVFLYSVFYYHYIPKISYTKPVHFQFEPCDHKPGICSFPSANVSLSDDSQNRIIIRGQKYRVFLELEMPESPVNQNLGMFQVKALMKTKMGALVQSSIRTAMLQYRSSLVHTIKAMLFSPAFLSGTAAEKQTVFVELFSVYDESVGLQATEAHIEIQTKYIEMYSAHLKIHAHFTGLRYLMFNYPLISAVAGISSVLFFLSIGAFVSWYRLFIHPIKNGIVVRVGFNEDSSAVRKSFEDRKAEMKEKIYKERKRSMSSSSIASLTSLVDSSIHRVVLPQVEEAKDVKKEMALASLEDPGVEICTDSKVQVKTEPLDSESVDGTGEQNDDDHQQIRKRAQSFRCSPGPPEESGSGYSSG